MRYSSSWGVLALLVLGCSSSTHQSSTTNAAMGVPGYSGNAGGPAPGASDERASDMSPAAPEEAAPSAPAAGDGNSQSGNSQSGSSEAPMALPLAPSGAPEPTDGSSAPSGEPASDDAPMPMPMSPPAAEPPPAKRLENVLVFTRTAGFRHDSIEAGFQALQRLGQDNGFALQRTEAPADFNDQNLARFDAVVWLNTDSEVMDDPARRAFERYIRAGGGWVGVHAASASEYNWAWYGQLIGGGAYFRDHPAVQNARVNVEIADHPSTAHLPQSFVVQDEWYSFRANPRASVHVLLTLDESSYGVGELAMGDHPIAWYHEFDGGRAWYTALGHPIALYSDARFTQHLLGGIRWAAGVDP